MKITILLPNKVIPWRSVFSIERDGIHARIKYLGNPDGLLITAKQFDYIQNAIRQVALQDKPDVPYVFELVED